MASTLNQLQAALHFDDNDLAQNRAGRLSPAQLTRLRQLAREQHKDPSSDNRTAGCAFGCFTVFFGFGGVVLLINIPGESFTWWQWPLVIALVVGMFGLAAGAAYFLVRVALSGRQMQRQVRADQDADAAEGRVLQASGPVRYDPDRYAQQGLTDTMQVGGEWFDWTDAVGNAMPQGASFTVYYTPRMRVIVAAEPL